MLTQEIPQKSDEKEVLTQKMPQKSNENNVLTQVPQKVMKKKC